MKKIFYLPLLWLGMVLIGCEKQEPKINIQTGSPLLLEVGDSALVEVQYTKEAHFSYGESRDESNPVFEISDCTSTSTIVHALNPGADTLFVGYHYTRGIFAYGHQTMVLVKVVEK